MRVNLKQEFVLSHLAGVQRPILLWNQSNHKLSSLDIFFYSQSWTAYQWLLGAARFTVNIISSGQTDAFDIIGGSAGESPLNPITWSRSIGAYEVYEATGVNHLHLIYGDINHKGGSSNNIFTDDSVKINIVNNVVSSYGGTSGFGGSNIHGGTLPNSGYGGTQGDGFGGIAPDSNLYLKDIICVIQPSVFNEKEIFRGSIVDTNIGIKY